MSLLFNPELDSALNANGTESVKDIDASLFQGVGKGASTGFSNAGTSLQRISLTTLGRGQMQVAAAQMYATADITGNKTLSDAAQDILTAPELTEEQLPQYKSFDSDQVGAVGTILGGLVQQSPSLALMVVNPVAGVSVAGAQGYTEAHAEGAKLGLKGKDLEDYAAVGGATMAVGAAIPGFTGVGKGAVLYGSRFLAGGVVNSATGELDRWGRAEILDSAGFHEQARQMRQADAASRVTEFVLGGAFGLLGGGHKNTSISKTPRMSSDEIRATFGDKYQPSPDGSTETLVRDLADSGVIKIFDSPAVDNGDGTSSLIAGKVTSGPDEKASISINLNGIRDHKDLLDTLHHEAMHLEQRNYPDWKARKLANAVLKSALDKPDTPEFAYGLSNFERYREQGNFDKDGVDYPSEWVRNEEVAAHAVEPSVKSRVPKWSELTSQLKAYIYRHSGVQLGKVTPEQLRSIVAQRLNGMQLDAAIERELGRVITGQGLPKRDSTISSIHEDAATAHIIHDNYVTETAPGLSADARSESGHVAAMDTAIDSINRGRAVDVTDHLTGDRTFIVHGDIDAGNVARQQLAGDASKRVDSVVQSADQQAIPEKVNSYSPGVLSDATDQPFQLLREQMDAVAENHPELRDLVAQHIDNFEVEHITARRNAELYDVAAACALKFGS